jgi:hypothetical protein
VGLAFLSSEGKSIPLSHGLSVNIECKMFLQPIARSNPIWVIWPEGLMIVPALVYFAALKTSAHKSEQLNPVCVY